MPSHEMLKVGMVGCGFIGTTLARAIDGGVVEAELLAVYDRNTERARKLAASLSHPPKVMDIESMAKSCELVVECASQNAVRGIARTVLSNECSLMVMSVGALLDEKLRDELEQLARAHGERIYVPSGAVAGLDGLRAACVGKIHRMELTTTKPPMALVGAPYLTEANIDVKHLKVPTVVFEGTAIDAVKGFPANINVAAAISLAGIGAERTQVRIVADPSAHRNTHTLLVEGEFGRLECTVQNVPSPENPKTSMLAALSAISTLKRIAQPLQVG